ncbi:MAG: VCBS repeat-containing protein [Planctomycetota bacterium]
MRTATLFLLAAATALAGPEFTETRIEVREKVDSSILADIDGDGLQDVVIQVGRRVDAHRLTPAGTFATPVSVELPKKAFLFDLFPVSGAKASDLVYLTTDGVYALAWDGKAFVPLERALVQIPTLFEGESTGSPLRYPFASDVDGDGRQDLVVPQRQRLLVYLQRAGGTFQFSQRVPVDMQVRLETGGGSIQNQVSSTVRVPPYYIVDFNGDALPDLGVVQADLLLVHLQKQGNTLPSVPSYEAVVGIDRKKPRRRLLTWEIPPVIEDLNADGLADAVVTTVSKGTTQVFLGDLAVAAPARIQQIKVDGWTFRHWVVDVNADGRRDLVLAKVDKLGVSQALQVLITGKIDATILLFLQGPDGKYPDIVDYELPLSVPFVVAFSGNSVQVESPVMVDPRGDYDKDGRADLLVKTENDELTLYLSGGGAIFDEGHSVTVRTMDTEEFSFSVFENFEPLHLVDLNGDGKTDIVLHHKTFEGTYHVLEVLLSR